MRAAGKKDGAHCAPSFPFSRIDIPSLYAPRPLSFFPSYFRVIGETACLRHRLMFASRNTTVFFVSHSYFSPLPYFPFLSLDISDVPSATLSLSDSALPRYTSPDFCRRRFARVQSRFLIKRSSCCDGLLVRKH